MRIQVDIDQSIKAERIKAVNLEWWQKFDIGAYIFLALLMLFFGFLLPIVVVIQLISKNAVSLIGLAFLTPFCLIGLLIVHGLIHDNKLKRFKGENLEINKRVITSVLENRYPGREITVEDTMICLYTNSTLWKFATRLIVIFDNNDVLINLSKFNQRGIKSFFHPFFTNKLINTFIEDFHRQLLEEKSISIAPRSAS